MTGHIVEVLNDAGRTEGWLGRHGFTTVREKAHPFPSVLAARMAGDLFARRPNARHLEMRVIPDLRVVRS